LENALSYAEKYMDDRRKFDNGGKAVSEVKEEYDRQLELQRVDSEQKLKRMWLYLLIAMLVIALLLLWLFVLRYRKNKELETLQLHEAQRQLQADLEQLTVQQKEMLQQQVVAIYQTGQKDRLQRIMEAFETVYPNALEKLKSAYPDLNKTELNLVFLSFFQFRIKEEADLLGISENTVMKYRSKLNKKVDFASISTLTD
jgi:DNA-binding CsgD family transcriptional regulator